MWFCFKINTVSFILPAAVTQKTALEMSFEHRFTIHIYIYLECIHYDVTVLQIRIIVFISTKVYEPYCSVRKTCSRHTVLYVTSKRMNKIICKTSVHQKCLVPTNAALQCAVFSLCKYCLTRVLHV